MNEAKMHTPTVKDRADERDGCHSQPAQLEYQSSMFSSQYVRGPGLQEAHLWGVVCTSVVRTIT